MEVRIMTKEVCRAMARAGYPVVTLENGAHGEIVYPYIREIKVVYASPEERAAGYPTERLVVVLADKCGFSFTEVLARQLRLPTVDEAMSVIPESMTLAEVDDMLAELKRMEEIEKQTGKEGLT
jgi:hypothetical protein